MTGGDYFLKQSCHDYKSHCQVNNVRINIED